MRTGSSRLQPIRKVEIFYHKKKAIKYSCVSLEIQQGMERASHFQLGQAHLSPLLSHQRSPPGRTLSSTTWPLDSRAPGAPWGSERVIHVRTWGRVVPHMCVFACVFACVPVERNLYVQMEEGVIADCERRV